MKAKRNILFVISVVAILCSCRKETLPPATQENQPVFSFNGTIGGNSLNMQAGVNNYYMYSSFIQDSVGHDSVVYSFIGDLQSTATTKNSIQISINDYKVSKQNESVSLHIDTALSITASYSYNKPGGDTTGYLVKFTPTIYYGTATRYSYVFGDGSTSSLVSPTHLYADTGNYNTSLSVQFSSCGSKSISNPIGIKNTSSLIIDSIHSVALPPSGDSVQVALSAGVSGGTTPYTYSWNLGDGSTSSLPTPLHSYIIDSLHSIDTCVLFVTDHSHNTANYENIVQNSGVPTCRFDYSMSSPVPVINTYSFSNITIVYTDGNGNIYTSLNSSQPSSSTFKINSVSDYKNNLNNQPTKQLKVTFNCLLYNGSNTIQASGTAIIAIAYQ